MSPFTLNLVRIYGTNINGLVVDHLSSFERSLTQRQYLPRYT